MTTIPELPDETPSLVALVPANILGSLRRYAVRHVPVGHFLTAILSNDLFEAVGRADEENAVALLAICRYVYNCLPASCWGSPEKVREWLASPPAVEGELWP